jgi:hypothetical protein
MQPLTHGVVISKDGILRRNENVTAQGNLKPTSHSGAPCTRPMIRNEALLDALNKSSHCAMNRLERQLTRSRTEIPQL